MEEENRFPKITIITSTFNCADSLSKTALSIQEQTYKNIQWIVADGASIDGTVDVIKKYSDIVTDWFSEPDSGIYDAWNKACKLINGEWILFLGAGDTLYCSSTLSELIKYLIDLPDDVVIAHGNVVIMSSATGKERYIDTKPCLYGWEFARPRLPHHQGTLQRRVLFEDESFDKTYKIAADSKFMLQAKKYGRFEFIDIIISSMSDDGASNNFNNNFFIQSEINRICKELEIRQPFFELIKAYFYRTSGFVVHKLLPSILIKKIRAKIDKDRLK